MRIAFCGLSHLSTCHMVAAHIQGFDVTAFDTDADRLHERQAGLFDTAEPGITEHLVENGDSIQFTAQLSDLNKCDLVIIALDTHTDASGIVDLSYLEGLVEVVLNGIDSEIPVILMSQVPPGFTRRIGKGRGYFFYQVETLIFGDGLRRALEPERYIFGYDEGQTIPDAIQVWHAAGNCPVIAMSLESAELAKMSINTFLAAQLMTTSTLAELAANIGADWEDIAKTLRLDRRIGSNSYLTPGMGIGGTNIKRDLVGLKQIAEKRGTRSQLLADFLDGSEYYLSWMQRVVQDLILRHPSLHLGILGLAYKPGTKSSTNSPGMHLAQYCGDHIDVTVHDPHVSLTPTLSDRVRIAQSPLEAIHHSDVVVIACPWPDYEPLDEAVLKWDGLALIDPNNFLKTLDSPQNRSFELHSLGRPISYPIQLKGASK
jgi:UDPglucose 6-dehydrogenase